MHIRIADKEIGPGRPVFIIAEVGVNHNGDLFQAKKLVDAAIRSGADAVKFQTFKADLLVTHTGRKAKYQSDNEKKEGTQQEMLRRVELSYEDFAQLHSYCDERGIIFLSTPFEQGSAKFLFELNVPAFKVSSSDLSNIPFLRTIGEYGKPVILSSGMSTMAEIKDAIDMVIATGNEEIALLHCVSNYPTRPADLNLRVITTLKERIHKPIGFSDHSMGTYAAVAAVALGATIIEKHITLDQNAQGPDHKASLNPEEFKELVTAIRSTELALGSGEKFLSDEEVENRAVARKSLVASVQIDKGSIIEPRMIEIKRPGTGIPPKFLDQVVGKRVTRDIDPDEVLMWEDLE